MAASPRAGRPRTKTPDPIPNMNTTQLEFTRAEAGRSQNEKLRDHLRAHPRVWLAMVDLGRIIGAWAVHSRVNDCRKKFGMHIGRRVRLNPATGQREASYYFDPALPSNFGCQQHPQPTTP